MRRRSDTDRTDAWPGVRNRLQGIPIVDYVSADARDSIAEVYENKILLLSYLRDSSLGSLHCDKVEQSTAL